MPGFEDLIRQGGWNAWLFVPSALLLGALHGLEPGHSKTVMAAFIVAIRGTKAQAVLLGLSATLSHTALVWIVVLIGLQVGAQLDLTRSEPYFQIGSAILILAIALWTVLGTWRRQRMAARHSHDGHHHHEHSHDHDHSHGRDHGQAGHDHQTEPETQDAHAQWHADQVRRAAGTGQVTTSQIIAFGLTGGLIPCAAAVTVLLLCLQLKALVLGIVLVLCFSVGLAAVMVAFGVAAAYGMTHLRRRSAGLDRLAARAPYVSSAIIVLIGLYIGWQGVSHLS